MKDLTKQFLRKASNVTTYNEAKETLKASNIVTNVLLCAVYSSDDTVIAWCGFNKDGELFQVPLFKETEPMPKKDIVEVKIIHQNTFFPYNMIPYIVDEKNVLHRVTFMWYETMAATICKSIGFKPEIITVEKVIKKETGETTAIVWCIRNSQSPFSICLPLLEDFERVIEDEVEENPRDYIHEKMVVGESFAIDEKNYQLVNEKYNVLFFKEQALENLN